MKETDVKRGVAHWPGNQCLDINLSLINCGTVKCGRRSYPGRDAAARVRVPGSG